MIDNTLGSLVGTCCIAYLDNILVFSPSVEQHHKDLKSVFKALHSRSLKLKMSKCEFFKEQVSFLGNIIFCNGQAACPDKVAAVVNWKVPSNRTELRSFLGTVNFLRRYAKDLSEIAFPLSQLTSVKVPFSWGAEHQSAFEKIKEVMTCTPVLALPDPSKPFVLETDASNFAVGAVLLQAGVDGVEHPVAFFSRKMLPAENNYPVHDKEMLAIVSALKEWQHYL